MTTNSLRACGCPEFAALERSVAVSRRGFMGAAAGATAVMTAGQLFTGAYRQASFGAETGNNVVVVLSLRGGSDGLSIVVPRNAVDRQILRERRPNIYVPNSSLIGGDAGFGLHPSLEPLLPMWNNGAFGAVQAVGLPAPNLSHFDAMAVIEDADFTDSRRVGWINRMTGLDAAAVPETSVNLGSTLLPTSQAGPAPALGAHSVRDLTLANHGTGNATRRTSMEEMWAGQDDLLGRSVASTLEMTRRMAPLADAAGDEDNSPVRSSAYPAGPLRDVLANTSALIRADLGTRVITIDYGDWDMHAGLAEGTGTPDRGWMAEHLSHFAGSLQAFFDDLGSHASRVTVVTLSEFGRRVEENGDHGVDHGYGNAMLLLGAGVNGGAVHGNWPGLQNLEEGDLRVTRDYRSVLWEVMAHRFPAISGDRAQVFPNFTPETIGAMA